MFNKNLSKFIDKETGEYVATDGHVMGIEKTPDTYDTAVHTQSKAAKYIYIAFDSSGVVRGVFNKESDARKEATGGVKEFPLI